MRIFQTLELDDMIQNGAMLGLFRNMIIVTGSSKWCGISKNSNVTRNGLQRSSVCVMSRITT